MFRQAARTLVKNGGATIIVVLTIAVAIAATTVIYSAIDLVWGFVPILNRDRLAYITSTDTRVVQAEGTTSSVVFRSRVSMPDLADWSARSSSFEQFAAFEMGSVTLTGVEVPLRLSSVAVTWNLIDAWGFTPILAGRFERRTRARARHRWRCSRLDSGSVSSRHDPQRSGPA